jgi:outer membrane lipoprotein carrier protein
MNRVFRRFRCAFGALTLLVFTLVCPQILHAEDFLTDLERKLATVTTVRSDFIQETAIPMFANPMRTDGRFIFKHPDALIWEYLSPLNEGFSLKDGKGYRWENGRENRVSFTAQEDPVAAIIARQLVAWITFDIQSISREYHVERVESKALQLKMTPLREDMRSVIADITITFSQEGPASLVELNERGGGRTSITFFNTVINAPVNNEEFK